MEKYSRPQQLMERVKHYNHNYMLEKLLQMCNMTKHASFPFPFIWCGHKALLD